MPEANQEFANAVTGVLAWMNASPETAAAALAINNRTLSAMCQGIIPMRSLVIRFAEGVAHRCQGADGAESWWGDVDAWLAVAGYPARRDLPRHQAAPSSGSRPPSPGLAPSAPRASGPGTTGPGPRVPPNGNPSSAPRPPSQSAPLSGTRPTVQISDFGDPPPDRPRNSFAGNPPPRTNRGDPSLPEETSAREIYHPAYERQPFGDTFVHVFWILDGENRKVFQINLPANVDYKARAGQVKQDLASRASSSKESTAATASNDPNGVGANF